MTEDAARDPRWLGAAALGIVSATTAFAAVAAPLLIGERFRPELVLPLWAVGSGAAWVLGRSILRGDDGVGTAGRQTAVAAGVAVLVALGSAGWNAAHASGELFTFRDPGVYSTASGHLAETGTVRFDAREGPFDREDLKHDANGYYDSRDDGRVFPQFFHLLTAWMALGEWGGGDAGRFGVNALLGGLSLLLFYALGRRVLRPWFAVAATFALGVSLPQMFFARGAYSEVPTQLLLLGGLWVLWRSSEQHSIGPALLGGLAIGATTIARVDAFVFLAPLAGWAAIEAVRATGRDRDQRRARFRWLAGVGAGVSVTAALGLVHGLVLSPDYVRALSSQLTQLFTLLGAVVAVGALVLLTRRWWRGLVPMITLRRHTLGAVGATAVLVAGAFAAFVRPELGPAMRGHVRSHAETSLHWIVWYLGAPLVTAAVVGLSWFVYRLVHDPTRSVRRLLPFVGVFGVSAFLYLWRPNIAPDHIWAMRRFLPAAIPGFVLLGFLAVDRFHTRLRDRKTDSTRNTAGLVAVMAVGALALPPAAISVPFADLEIRRPEPAAIDRVCDAMGPDAAAVVLTGEHLHNVAPMALRSRCEIPVATLPQGGDVTMLWDLERQWAARGRALFLVGVTPEQLRLERPTRLDVVHREPAESRLLPMTLGGRPEEAVTTTVELHVMQIPEGSEPVPAD